MNKIHYASNKDLSPYCVYCNCSFCFDRLYLQLFSNKIQYLLNTEKPHKRLYRICHLWHLFFCNKHSILWIFHETPRNFLRVWVQRFLFSCEINCSESEHDTWGKISIIDLFFFWSWFHLPSVCLNFNHTNRIQKKFCELSHSKLVVLALFWIGCRFRSKIHNWRWSVQSFVPQNFQHGKTK